MKIPTVASVLKLSREWLVGEGVIELETTLRSSTDRNTEDYASNANLWDWEDQDIDHEPLSKTLKRWRKVPPPEDVSVCLCAFSRDHKVDEIELSYRDGEWMITSFCQTSGDFLSEQIRRRNNL